LDAAPTLMTLSRIPGNDAGCITLRPSYRIRSIDGVFGKVECALRRPQIGIEIFQPQHLRIFQTVGEIAHLFDSDFADMGKA
jgi:hypothetical protein